MPLEKYSVSLIEKTTQLYDELVEKEIIPQIERESSEELSNEELSLIAEKLKETVEDYSKQIEGSEDVRERKDLRSKRKEPKKAHRQFQDFVARKQKYQKDMEIFQGRNSYSKTDHDATFMRM